MEVEYGEKLTLIPSNLFNENIEAGLRFSKGYERAKKRPVFPIVRIQNIHPRTRILDVW